MKVTKKLAGFSLYLSFRNLLFDPEAKSDGVAICLWYAGITTIRENWFYTEWVNDEDQEYARMLYDHRIDPEENLNISEDPIHAETIDGLSTEMRRSRAADYFK